MAAAVMCMRGTDPESCRDELVRFLKDVRFCASVVEIRLSKNDIFRSSRYWTIDKDNLVTAAGEAARYAASNCGDTVTVVAHDGG
ncbi:MAG: hypothetical protein ACREQX_02045 [Candidatus Binataceae bacterium]